MKPSSDTEMDFVVIWVDGADPDWRKKRAAYQPRDAQELVDDGEERYRDMGLLRYWFRGVERFAPWVRRVHFVTCGQMPDWLDLSCDRLHFVRHEDYMPQEYLPTFSSHPIELNLHRIEGLSERFVYFNDDMYLTSDVVPEDYFCGDTPRHAPLLHPILPMCYESSEVMSHIYINMVTAINRHFDARESLRRNARKWFLPSCAGLRASLMNAVYAQHADFVGFGNEHLPVPIRRATMERVWEAEHDLLHQTSLQKFRSSMDVSQYLFRYWDLASGDFVPVRAGASGARFRLSRKCDPACDAIRGQRHKMICLNDSVALSSLEDRTYVEKHLVDSFEEILPYKSCFEL